MTTRQTRAGSAAVLLILATACGSSTSSGEEAAPTTSLTSNSANTPATTNVVHIDADRTAPESMEDLVRSAAFVAEGIVTSSVVLPNLTPIPPDQVAKAEAAGATSLPDLLPNPSTIWTIHISAVIVAPTSSALEPDTDITVHVSGGVYQGSKYVFGDVPQFELGQTYVIFPVQYQGIPFLSVFPDTQSVGVMNGVVKLVGRDPSAPARDALAGKDGISEVEFLRLVSAAR